MTELTAHRTLALREAVANDPDTAFLAMLHALCLKLFYRFGLDSCLEIEAKSVLFGTQIEGLGDMPYATAIDARHGAWAAQLPKDPPTSGTPSPVSTATAARRCSRTAWGSPSTRRASPTTGGRRRIAHAGRLAEAVQLDMAAAGWRPTVGELSRPRHQGPDPRSGARGQGRAGGPADRGPQEGRHGTRGRAPAGRQRLAARAAATAGRQGAGRPTRPRPDTEALPAFLADDSDDAPRVVAAA